MRSRVAIMSTSTSKEADSSSLTAQTHLLVNCFATDDRPTCLVHFDSPPSAPDVVWKSDKLTYHNNALDDLLAETGSKTTFETWIDRLPFHHGQLRRFGQQIEVDSYAGKDWRLRAVGPVDFVVCCIITQSGVGDSRINPRNPPRHEATNHINDDFLLRVPQLVEDSYAASLMKHTWSDTPLGSMRNWHPVLREIAAMTLVCPSPRIIYWGNDFRQFYNEAAATIYKAKHPYALGRGLAKVWGQEVCDQVTSSFTLSSKTLKGTPRANIEHIIDRDGASEEAFFTYNALPICDANGAVLGHWLELFETTSTVLMKERAYVKHNAIEEAEEMLSPLDVWQRLVAVINPNEAKDMSYAMFFSAVECVRATQQPLDVISLDERYRVYGSWGVSNSDIIGGTPTLLVNILDANPEAKNEIIVLSKKANTIPDELAVVVEGYGTVNTVCVFRLENFNGHRLGFVVLGMNPRRRFDDDTRQFVQSLRDVFSRRTVLLSRPYEEDSNDIMRMYRDAPTGLFKFRPDGHPVFINDKWFDLVGITRESFEGPSGNFAWVDALWDDDKETIIGAWEHVLGGGSGAWDFRTKAHGPSLWVEVRGYPEVDENGKLVSIYGWVSDVSHRRRNEILIAEKLTDALEAKTAASQFIDIVSHEMRNPLGSILQLADSIVGTVESFGQEIPSDITSSIIDAAQTINLCAQHQKTIVDDILTLSKLDSKLVVLSPDVVQVCQVINKALKMVQVDMLRFGIESDIRIDPTFAALKVDYVSVDSSRLLQILLNLLTNAIKFTQHQLATRRITIQLSASITKPDGQKNGVRYITPRNQGNAEATHTSSSEDTQSFWLEFLVSDTGLGMTEEESSHLFSRFAQASPKTYKQYGGSGLGLFICRELAELLGGQIGLTSEYGIGTSLAFYVQAKHAEAPALRLPYVNGKKPRVSHVEMKDLIILLVEDNAINQKVMSRQLRKLGCKVILADHGEEALEYISAMLNPDEDNETPSISIILMDIEMPIMDGLNCTRKIREMEAAGHIPHHIPIAAITANSRQEQIMQARDAGMDDVFTKPFRISEIIPKIEALVTEWTFSE